MTENNRETLQLFDLMFKYMLKEASPPALVHLINGLFGTSYPPASTVTFDATESVSADAEKLEKITSDMIVTIAGDAFLIEAQIGDDENIALRVFQYGFAHSLRHKTDAENVITLTLPAARIIYWETTRKTPDKVTLRLLFPDKSPHDYEIEAFKVLKQSVATLGERNMALLFPFYLLKFRKAVRKPSTTSEQRKKLAGEMKALLRELADMVEEKRAARLLSGGDAAMILERMEQMHEELYRTYAEFEETKMELQERLKTHWQDYLQQGEQKIIGLMEQGYSLEQIKKQLMQESAQTPPQTR
ncbi:MAG: hypothetical protein LBK25_00665 [Treponema sp.]|jgi:hypothetical protein|nr:hypothetical protein [Treponema sp.]